MRAVALALAGVASASGGSVVFLGAYPGYAGNLSVTGTLRVSSTAGGIALAGIVAGLEPSATGGMHVSRRASRGTATRPRTRTDGASGSSPCVALRPLVD